MLPLLYQSSTAQPSADAMQYIGRITKCTKCVASEKLNGDYSLSAAFAATDPLIGEVYNQRYLLAKPNPTDEPQFFYIHQMDVDRSGNVTVGANHIRHICYNKLIDMELSNGAQSDTPTGHWNRVAQPIGDNQFSFSSDIVTQATMETGYTKIDTLGKFLEELKDAFSAEYHYDNFSVILNRHRGIKKNYVLRWNKNIDTPRLSLSTANLYTHIVAFASLTAKYTIEGTAYEYPIQLCSEPFSITSARNLPKIYMLDATNEFEETEINPISTPYSTIQSTLNSIAYTYAHGRAKSELQTAENVSLTVRFRPALDEMKAVGMGDTVDVMLKGGRTVEAKITATSFDCLAERWESITLGEERLKLADYIAKRR